MFRPMRRFQLIFDALLAVGFGLVALPAEVVTMTDRPYADLSAFVLVLFMAAALAVRRLSPGLALGLAWAGAIAQMAVGRPPGFADLAIFGVLYTTAAYGTRRVYWAGFVSCIVGAIAITMYLVGWALVQSGLSTNLPTAIFLLLAAMFALGLAWTVGALVRAARRARENRLAQEAAEEQTVAEQERTRIARDMHDVVAHSLAVVIAQADGARYAASADPAAATMALTTISATAREALADVRLLLTQLRHSEGEGPQPTLADLEQLYAQVRAAGVDLRVDVDPAPQGEPATSTQLAVYRILQEALTNALRHGGGPVDVTLAWHADSVDIAVRNPLAPAAHAPRAGGHGLIGMRERAQLVGGTLDAGAEDGVFAVRARLPLADAA